MLGFGQLLVILVIFFLIFGDVEKIATSLKQSFKAVRQSMDKAVRQSMDSDSKPTDKDKKDN